MSMKPRRARKATSLQELSQELWRLIFCRVPHDSRLRCLCVSQKWYRFLMELEDELKEANPGSPHLLVLEKKGEEANCEEEDRLQWSALDPVSSKKTKMKLSWPPGWDPTVHGCIQGGGRSGLVALWDAKASQYWVGSPVHDKWEKVPVLNTFEDLPFHRRGFHFIPDGRRCRSSFARKPAVPCFKPLKEWPAFDHENQYAEKSGFYSLVQFRVNETHERWPKYDRKVANWVIEAYHSKSGSWDITAKAFPEFRSLIHSCVSSKSVYFLAALEPSIENGDPRLGYLDEFPCPVSVWDYRLDTGALSFKLDWLFFVPNNIEKYWRSLQLGVSKGGNVSIISVGYPLRQPDQMSLYKLTCGHPEDPDEFWNIEEEIELDELCDGDMGFHEHIDSDSQDWGFNFLAFNPTEGHLEDLHEFAYAGPNTMYTQTEYLERAAAEVSGSTSILYFSEEERLWKRWELLCPLYRDGVLPVVPFLLCCDIPCCT